jgi:hypothetical protein
VFLLVDAPALKSGAGCVEEVQPASHAHGPVAHGPHHSVRVSPWRRLLGGPPAGATASPARTSDSTPSVVTGIVPCSPGLSSCIHLPYNRQTRLPEQTPKIPVSAREVMAYPLDGRRTPRIKADLATSGPEATPESASMSSDDRSVRQSPCALRSDRGPTDRRAQDCP